MGESTLTTIPGEYENGQIRLSGPAPVVLESTALSEEEGQILDELEAFREKHPFDLGSLADSND